MKKQLLFVFFVFAAVEISAQKNPYYFALNAYKEFGFSNPNSPYKIGGMAKISKLFMQAEYAFALPRKTVNQKLEYTENKALRIGYMGGGEPRGAFQSVGFYLGAEDLQKYKWLRYDESDFPVDRNGDPIEIEKVAVKFTGIEYCAGIQVLVVSKRESSDILDDYDLEIKKPNNKYSSLSMRIEFLYLTNELINKDISYSPYAYYIPRKVFINDNYKFKNAGFRFRLENQFAAGIGFLMQMSVMPGPKKSNDSYNDFRFDFTAGLYYSFIKIRK